MIDFSGARIEHLILHRVGNHHRDEPNILSDAPYPLNDVTQDMLAQYFFKPFLKNEDRYRFSHNTDLEYHVMNGLTNDLINDPSVLIDSSVDILNHLYNQSNHPHIKSGDVFIALIDGIFIEDEVVNAIGVFKAENKDHFIKISAETGRLELFPDSGINIKKLDKGCIILNILQDEGYQVLSVDQNNYDAEYWKEAFLGLEYIKNDHYETRNYMQLCQSFASEVLKPYEGKQEEVVFLNEAVSFMNDNEQLTMEGFMDEVITEPSRKKVFEEYKQQYEYKHDVAIADEFEISEQELKKQKRKIKNQISLDTNIQIKLDFNNPESSKRFIEKGYDDEKGMSYYKVYFNSEQ